MANRDFSDSVKLNVITENLRKNSGFICCSVCGKKLSSIAECHFDHIVPYAKGGKSTEDNCQILCVNCNLKKSDKELADFILEEKAKKFLAGGDLTEVMQIEDIDSVTFPEGERKILDNMTKAEFDRSISDFISRKGDIHKVDFDRGYNHLPSIHYMEKYYRDIQALKKAFAVEDLSAGWNRETIRVALKKFVEKNGGIRYEDMSTKNNLPSLPCVLRHFPEYKRFSDIKKNMLGLTVRKNWDLESITQVGKDYVKRYGKIMEKDFCAKNGLPSVRVVYNYFESLSAYQRAVGSPVSQQHEFVTEMEIENAVKRFFGEEERVVVSMKRFFERFPYSPSTIQKRFGTFGAFCQKYNIIVRQSKKAKYSKQEIDDAIAKWVKAGKKIPLAKELSKLGLPSMTVILKYYEDWKEPFVLYQKLYDKLNG